MQTQSAMIIHFERICKPKGVQVNTTIESKFCKILVLIRK